MLLAPQWGGALLVTSGTFDLPTNPVSVCESDLRHFWTWGYKYDWALFFGGGRRPVGTKPRIHASQVFAFEAPRDGLAYWMLSPWNDGISRLAVVQSYVSFERLVRVSMRAPPAVHKSRPALGQGRFMEQRRVAPRLDLSLA